MERPTRQPGERGSQGLKSGTLEQGYHGEKADAALKSAVVELYKLYPAAFRNYSWSGAKYARTCWSIVDEEATPTKMGKLDGHIYLKPLGDVRPTIEKSQYWGHVMKEKQERVAARAALCPKDRWGRRAALCPKDR